MNPLISVVIPAWNEEKLLPRCLDSLHEQNFPKNKFEIIVVDNGSTDKTALVAKQNNAIVFPYSEEYGISAAKRYGASQAKGKIIAFTDADSIVEPSWLGKIEQAFKDPKLVCIGGQILPDKKSFLQKTVCIFYNNFHIVNNYFGKPIMWGLNMAVRTDAYEKVGGLNGDLPASEDWDLAFRLKRDFGKGSVKYIPDLKVFTSTRKQDNMPIFLLYAKNGLSNYIDFVILGKTKAKPAFHVR